MSQSKPGDPRPRPSLLTCACAGLGVALLASAPGPRAAAQPAAVAAADVGDPLDATQPGAGAPPVVESLHDALLGVMRDAEQLGYGGRYQRLWPVLTSHFDTLWMAEKSIGRHWKKMSEEEQAAFVDTVRRFMTANYAGRFDGYGGQHFATVKREPSLHGTVLVYTRLEDPGGDVTELNYRLHRVGDQWKIIDVYLNGTVSEVALRRSEYSALIKRDGLDALLDALEDKIAKLAAGEVQS